MTEKYEQLQNSIADIASELFRFQRVFEKAIKKLSIEEQNKYISQFSWFSKIVLSFNMLLGRLEIFPLIVLFSPRTWRK